jgi:hypothetical protein
LLARLDRSDVRLQSRDIFAIGCFRYKGCNLEQVIDVRLRR